MILVERNAIVVLKKEKEIFGNQVISLQLQA